MNSRANHPESPEHRFSIYRRIIPDFTAFCRKLAEPLPRHLRLNTLKAAPSRIRTRLQGRGVLLQPEDSNPLLVRARNLEHPGHLPEFALGHFHIQALSSALAGLALKPGPGDMVLDLCAAPGSKTTLLAQLMENRGIIMANDRSMARLVALKANLKRLGVSNTITSRYPGQHFPKRCAFDRVLVDVPCSAEGTLRLTPEGRWPSTVTPRAKLVSVQHQLLLRAFDLLKPEGTLVYSTCTYNPEENEGALQFLLEKRPAFIRPISLEAAHSPGLSRWQESVYDPSLKHCWRIYPHQLDTVGFFLAAVGKQL